MAQAVQQPVDDVEEKFLAKRVAALGGLAGGFVKADQNVCFNKSLAVDLAP